MVRCQCGVFSLNDKRVYAVGGYNTHDGYVSTMEFIKIHHPIKWEIVNAIGLEPRRCWYTIQTSNDEVLGFGSEFFPLNQGTRILNICSMPMVQI